MNPWITSQVVYLSIYLLAVYTGIVTGSDYEINGTQTNAKVYTTAEPGVNIRTVVGYNKYTKERATSYQLSSSRLAYFVINKNTGTISTALKINQSVGYQFSLTVIAKFGNKSTEHRNLRVDVVQMNRDKPQFQSSLVTFIIHRRIKNETVIGNLSATDQSVEEYNRRLTYSIRKQDEPKVFEVSKDGVLRVIGKIPTHANVLNFTVSASDNGYPTKKALQSVSVKISNIPALTKFCTVKDGFEWQICWKYEPPSSQRYFYHIEIRSGMYTHNNSVVGGTEHCYSAALLDGPDSKYFYRVQTRLGNNRSPFSEWKEAGEFCEINNICQEKNPCNEQSVCMNTENGGYKCVCKPSFSGTNCTIKASCNEDIQKDDTGRYVWPATFYGRTAIIPCKYAKSAGENASRPCIFNTTLNQAQWGRMDTSHCEKIGDEEASKAMKNLRSLTEHPQTLTAEQVANVTEKLEEIFSYSLKKREIADNMVQVISNMLEANTTVMSTSNKMNNTSERLKRLLENYSANVSISGNTVINLQSSNIILMVQEISTTEKLGSTLNLHPIFEDDKDKKLEFVIPWDSIKENRSRKPRKTDDGLEERVQMIAYNNAKFYFSENQSETNINQQSVIFVKIKGRELKNLADPVTYTISNLELNQNHTCVYWDTISKNWSTEGIVTKVSSFNETVCESDHLTSFSLLLAVSPEKPLPVIHEMVLTYISYIGCSISIFGIVLTIITYGLFGCLHGDPSGRILLNLCSSLLFLNVSFLMASQVNTLQIKYNETSAETLCIIVAILIHYFLLTTLAWMCVEAINMYQMLVTVFNIYHSRFMLKRVLAAWGIPALTVGITLGIDIRNYKTAIGYCFLSYGNRTAFYVALLTPACVILFINTVVFGMVTKVIMKPKFKNKHQCSSAVSSVQVRGCFTVMVLLGVTWLFGPLAINEMKIFFNYLFCILNSLQGFFIFVFRCLLNPEAKMAWVQLIKMGTLKKKKGPRKSVDSSSNGMYGGGGGGGGQLGHRWSQKTMTVEIRDNTNLKKLSKPNDNGIYEKNISYESCRNKWDQSNGSTYQSDKPVEFTRL